MELNEVFPVVAGAVIGLVVWTYVPARLRAVAVVVLSVAAGVTASAISGELELSWGFVPIDVAQALIAAVLAFFAARLWERRTSRV